MTKPILILQNIAAEGPGTILAWLNEHALPFTVVHTYRHQEIPDIDSIEAAVCLGCPHSVAQFHDHEYLRNLHAWVAGAVREDKPYLGICFGGQLLAGILGARIESGNVREIGVYHGILSDGGAADLLFAGFEREFPIFHWHNDTFRTPFNAVHLVSDSRWQHQAFRKNRQIGLQFHLEPTADDVARWCDLYAPEAEALGKTKAGILSEFETVAPTLRKLNFQMLDNWLG